jgi:hypothetical protein
MQETSIPNQYEDDISLLDIVQFIKDSYKKVALLALGGLVCAVAFLPLHFGSIHRIHHAAELCRAGYSPN